MVKQKVYGYVDVPNVGDYFSYDPETNKISMKENKSYLTLKPMSSYSAKKRKGAGYFLWSVPVYLSLPQDSAFAVYGTSDKDDVNSDDFLRGLFSTFEEAYRVAQGEYTFGKDAPIKVVRYPNRVFESAEDFWMRPDHKSKDQEPIELSRFMRVDSKNLDALAIVAPERLVQLGLKHKNKAITQLTTN